MFYPFYLELGSRLAVRSVRFITRTKDGHTATRRALPQYRAASLLWECVVRAWWRSSIMKVRLLRYTFAVFEFLKPSILLQDGHHAMI